MTAPFSVETVKKQREKITLDDQTDAAKRELRVRRKRAERTEDDREYVRHEIQAHRHVKDLEEMCSILQCGWEPVSDAQVPLDKSRVAQLAACANIKLALLRKVLPDIKAVELTGAGGEELGSQRQLAEIELRNRLRAALTQQAIEVEYECLG